MEVRNISIRKGEIYPFKLGGLGSAGYVWTYIVECSPGIVEVSTEQVETSPTLPRELPPRSSSTDTLFIIKALEPGNAKIRLVLKRPWEQTKPPLRELELEVSISNKKQNDQS